MSEEIQYKLGSHTLKERNKFIDDFTKGYMERHPEKRLSIARRQARLRWAKKLKREEKAKQHVNPIQGLEKKKK